MNESIESRATHSLSPVDCRPQPVAFLIKHTHCIVLEPLLTLANTEGKETPLDFIVARR